MCGEDACVVDHRRKRVDSREGWDLSGTRPLLCLWVRARSGAGTWQAHISRCYGFLRHDD